MSWNTNDVLTNPGDDAILADTGALGVGSKDVTVLIDAPDGGVAYLEERNALNTATIHSQRFVLYNALTFLQLAITLGINERLRLRLESAITGTIQGSIFI